MARAHRYEVLPHVHALLAQVEQADATSPPTLPTSTPRACCNGTT